MSGIESLEQMSEYAPNRYEEKNAIEMPEALQDEQTKAPELQAAVEAQDKKTTTHGFQYTGKGAFIDGVF